MGTGRGGRAKQYSIYLKRKEERKNEQDSIGRGNPGGGKQVEGVWGIEEPLRLSGGFYQNYCNISVTNRKIRKKKRQTWAGVLTQELGYLPETESEWLEAFNLTGCCPLLS